MTGWLPGGVQPSAPIREVEWPLVWNNQPLNVLVFWRLRGGFSCNQVTLAGDNHSNTHVFTSMLARYRPEDLFLPRQTANICLRGHFPLWREEKMKGKNKAAVFPPLFTGLDQNPDQTSPLNACLRNPFVAINILKWIRVQIKRKVTYRRCMRRCWTEPPHPHWRKVGSLEGSEILLPITVHCSDLFVLCKSADREKGIHQRSSPCVGGSTISPDGLNTSLLNVPRTQGLSRLICGPLAARPALLHGLGPPNSLEVPEPGQGLGKCLRNSEFFYFGKEISQHALIK